MSDGTPVVNARCNSAPFQDPSIHCVLATGHDQRHRWIEGDRWLSWADRDDEIEVLLCQAAFRWLRTRKDGDSGPEPTAMFLRLTSYLVDRLDDGEVRK
jgi:hypothetical protein